MKHIALIGNATWLNRGCEAIEVSTRALLVDALSDVRFTCVPFTIGDCREAADTTPGVHRLPPPDFDIPWMSYDWVRWRVHRRLGTGREYRALVSRYESTAESIGDVDAIVSVGGDNYSFDYGRPSRFWALNDFWRQRGVPVFVWGASVGPFPHGADEHVAASSLRGVSRIFARELDTVSYLDSIGVSENVSVSADPAFTLEPETCDEVNLAGELGSCVGLNLSPLFGRYTGLGPDEWLEASVQCVLRMGEVTGRRIVLVPHVMLEGQSDEAFLWRIAERVGSSVDLAVLPGHLSARQLKACIARFSVFVGARTHATIAALSSLVPTVTLAYSTKAYGINREIFGHTDYVMSAAEFDPNRLALMATAMLDDKEAVRALEERVPPLVQRARESAATLAGVLGVSVGSGA